MKTVTASRLAWAALAAMVVAVVAVEVLAVALGSGGDPFVVAMLAFPVVGATIAARQPRNAVGWVLLLIGAVWVGGGVLAAYGLVGLTALPWLPGAAVAIALSTAVWVPGIGLIGTFVLLLFPDGHLPSPRWRAVAWGSAAALAACYVAITITPGPLDAAAVPATPNPLGVGLPAAPTLVVLLIALVPLCIVACASSVILRFRRARGLERLQLQWLAAAAAGTACVYATLVALHLPYVFSTRPVPWWIDAAGQVSAYAFVLIPTAVGIAILRHRLYDIDVIINRALVYGLLTAALSAAYVVVVTVLQGLLRPAAGRSDLSVAGSTLIVAMLFQPGRVRIQAIIDRTFYRRRYDAGRTLHAFAARLRNDIDVDTLRHDLIVVVGDVMQPAHAALWLRPTDGGRSDGRRVGGWLPGVDDPLRAAVRAPVVVSVMGVEEPAARQAGAVEPARIITHGTEPSGRRAVHGSPR